MLTLIVLVLTWLYDQLYLTLGDMSAEVCIAADNATFLVKFLLNWDFVIVNTMFGYCESIWNTLYQLGLTVDNLYWTCLLFVSFLTYLAFAFSNFLEFSVCISQSFFKCIAFFEEIFKSPTGRLLWNKCTTWILSTIRCPRAIACLLYSFTLFYYEDAINQTIAALLNRLTSYFRAIRITLYDFGNQINRAAEAILTMITEHFHAIRIMPVHVLHEILAWTSLGVGGKMP